MIIKYITKMGDVYYIDTINPETGELSGVIIEDGTFSYGSLGPLDKETMDTYVKNGYAKRMSLEGKDVCDVLDDMLKTIKSIKKDKAERKYIESSLKSLCKKGKSKKAKADENQEPAPEPIPKKKKVHKKTVSTKTVREYNVIHKPEEKTAKVKPTKKKSTPKKKLTSPKPNRKWKVIYVTPGWFYGKKPDIPAALERFKAFPKFFEGWRTGKFPELSGDMRGHGDLVVLMKSGKHMKLFINLKEYEWEDK